MKKFSFKLFSAAAFLLLTLPLLASAQRTPGSGSGGNPPIEVKVVLENPFKVGNDLYQVAEAVVKNVVMPIGGILCVLGFIYAGFIYVTAQGRPAQYTKANNALLYSAIGTAVLLGSWVLAQVIRTTIGALSS
jgi:hypothetical protein